MRSDSATEIQHRRGRNRTWPELTQHMSGVPPFTTSTASTLAPAAMSRWVIPSCPSLAAECSGVDLETLCDELGSAPASKSAATTSVCPFCTPHTSGESPDPENSRGSSFGPAPWASCCRSQGRSPRSARLARLMMSIIDGATIPTTLEVGWKSHRNHEATTSPTLSPLAPAGLGGPRRAFATSTSIVDGLRAPAGTRRPRSTTMRRHRCPL